MQKKFLIILTFVFLFSSVYARENFIDIDGHWAKEYIEDLNRDELIKGYEDNTFKPNNEILNVEVISIINKIIKFDKQEEIEFENDSQAQWYYEDLKKAKAAGYIEIDKNFEIKPISRVEMCQIISKVYKLDGYDFDVSYFKDCNDLSKEEKQAISALVMNKIVNGYENGLFNPEGKLTRAEFSKIISISIDTFSSENVENKNEEHIVENIDELKEKLLELIKKSKDLELERYSQESISNLNSEIFIAEKILGSSTDKKEFLDSINKIEEAVRNLKYISNNPKLTFEVKDSNGQNIDFSILLNDEDYENGKEIKPGRYFVRINSKGMEEYQTYIIVDDKDKIIEIQMEKENSDDFELKLSRGLSSEKSRYRRNERVTVKINIPNGMDLDSFIVNGKNKKLLSDEYIFLITEDTKIEAIFK